MLTNRSNLNTFGSILCGLVLRGFASSGFGEILGLKMGGSDFFFFRKLLFISTLKKSAKAISYFII